MRSEGLFSLSSQNSWSCITWVLGALCPVFFGGWSNNCSIASRFPPPLCYL